ncbi:hypothetical protein FHS43_003059 [Streptosporangium becharense]|uniref:Uncharacterized protein n=1 Tax=Streptosporangium becharense TaxID=1816182 RepID=A0A7W9ILA2_9ACTN|nr:hypothetical protein [Streptosporangium becharense]MBB2911786.1 hypothetical protein [Streptosporangium becharense]MBB5822396.1 hypothetical protein [Streptosporangium becharense]
MNDWPELPGFRDGIPDPPGPEIVRSVLARAALDGVRAPAAPRWYRAWALLEMEARLLRTAIWVLSALLTAAGAIVVTIGTQTAEAMFALAAPLVTAAGVAWAHGSEQDGAFEIVAVTPTSPRVIMLTRMTLVFGYNLTLALLASAALALLGKVPAGMTSLITAWLGPMALLAALTLLLSVCWTPNAAVGVATSLWGVRALSVLMDDVDIDLDGLWTTSPATLALAAGLTLAAVVLTGGGEPIRRGRATPWW